MKHTKRVMIGKKSGAFIGSVPKYFAALGPSKLPYFAFAGSVHGGLLPAVLLKLSLGLTTRFHTAANV